MREADRRIYELLNAADVDAPVEPSAHQWPVRRWRGGTTLAGLAVLMIAGFTLIERRSLTTGPPDDFVPSRSLPPAQTNMAVAESNRADVETNASPAEKRPAISPRRTRQTVRGGDQLGDAAVSRALDSDNPMFSPSFAPDGTAMFFHTGRTKDPHSALMRVQDVSTAAPVSQDLRVLSVVDDGARNYHVQPSPDGSRIAFDSDRDGVRGVYLAASDGTNVRRVSGAGYAAVPTWSPDGQRLAFVRGESDRPNVWNLWLLTLSTNEMVRVTSFRFSQTWGASWFPDGRHICYSHEDRLFMHDLDTGHSRQYASPIPGRLVRTPAVSPDGRRVIFQVAGHGAWILDLADESKRIVLTDPTAEEFAWSPDGRRVAFHSRRDGGWGIWFTAGS